LKAIGVDILHFKCINKCIESTLSANLVLNLTSLYPTLFPSSYIILFYNLLSNKMVGEDTSKCSTL